MRAKRASKLKHGIEEKSAIQQKFDLLYVDLVRHEVLLSTNFVLVAMAALQYLFSKAKCGKWEGSMLKLEKSDRVRTGCEARADVYKLQSERKAFLVAEGPRGCQNYPI